LNQGAADPVIIVGLPDAAVKESRDRVTTAIEIAAIFGRAGPTKVNLALAGI
jgi:predicted ATPase with chaperone activity